MLDRPDTTAHLAQDVVVLSDEDRATLLDAAEHVRAYDPVEDVERFVTEAQIQAAKLSEPLRRALIDFRRHGNPVGGLLLRGVPVGELPSTPPRADQRVGLGLLAAATMSILAAPLGEQFGFEPELGGTIVQDVLPLQGAEGTQWSVSSDVRLEDHVEIAFSDYRPDYVGLMCTRPDHDRVAGTTLASIDRILPQLDAATIEVLREARYKTSVDPSFLIGADYEDDIWIGPIAVIVGTPERPRLRGDFALTEGLDEEAQAAFERLRDAVVNVTVEHRLLPGDLLFVDNHRAFHGRTWFRAHWDGMDRWLLRTFVTKDLGKTEAVRPGDGRIVDTDYSVGPDVLHEDAREAQPLSG